MCRIKWLAAFVVLATGRWAIAAEPPVLDLKAGKQASFRVQEEGAGAVTVMGQTQEEKGKTTYHLTAVVGEKDSKGRVPVTLKVKRIEASVNSLTNNATIDTESLDQTKPLPAHQFIPAIALMRRPVQLLYEPSGKLVGVAGTEMLQAEIDKLLKDFSGDPEIAFAADSYKANAREPAMMATWSDMLTIELPKDFQVGKEWETTEEMPLAPFEMTFKSKSVAKDAGDGSLRVESKIDVPPTQPKTVKLGPLDWTYAIKNGSGSGSATRDAGGWVRESNTEIEMIFGGTFAVCGMSFPFDMNLKLKFHVERVTPNK